MEKDTQTLKESGISIIPELLIIAIGIVLFTLLITSNKKEEFESHAFKVKVFYQNGDTETLNVKPIATYGRNTPVKLFIVRINGGQLKSDWTLEVNGTRVEYYEPIAIGVRRFEKPAN